MQRTRYFSGFFLTKKMKNRTNKQSLKSLIKFMGVKLEVIYRNLYIFKSLKFFVLTSNMFPPLCHFKQFINTVHRVFNSQLPLADSSFLCFVYFHFVSSPNKSFLLCQRLCISLNWVSCAIVRAFPFLISNSRIR